MNILRLILILCVPVIGGCAGRVSAPVEDRGVAPIKPVEQAQTSAAVAAAEARGSLYTVKKGDTLYSIALDNGRDYKDVAAWNNLENPNLIRIGQQLRVAPPDNGAPVAVSKPVASGGPVEVKAVSTPIAIRNTETIKGGPKGGKLVWSEEALAKARQDEMAPKPVDAKPELKPEAAHAEAKPAEKPVIAGDEVDWMWPVNGKLIAPFVDGSSKGIDIAGKSGDPVLAAAGGVVSYAGAGLRGYGNLVVLRHNASFLSVYAHNSKLLVKEKDTVVKGQKIAEMGSTDTESPRLHFEIRRQGKPTDPLKFLPAR